MVKVTNALLILIQFLLLINFYEVEGIFLTTIGLTGATSTALITQSASLLPVLGLLALAAKLVKLKLLALATRQNNNDQSYGYGSGYSQGVSSGYGAGVGQGRGAGVGGQGVGAGVGGQSGGQYQGFYKRQATQEAAPVAFRQGGAPKGDNVHTIRHKRHIRREVTEEQAGVLFTQVNDGYRNVHLSRPQPRHLQANHGYGNKNLVVPIQTQNNAQLKSHVFKSEAAENFNIDSFVSKPKTDSNEANNNNNNQGNREGIHSQVEESHSNPKPHPIERANEKNADLYLLDQQGTESQSKPTTHGLNVEVGTDSKPAHHQNSSEIDANFINGAQADELEGMFRAINILDHNFDCVKQHLCIIGQKSSTSGDVAQLELGETDLGLVGLMSKECPTISQNSSLEPSCRAFYYGTKASSPKDCNAYFTNCNLELSVSELF